MKRDDDNRLTPRGRPVETGGKAETDNLSRRTVLRRALAIGCGVLIPFTLLGCEKKEEPAARIAPAATDPETPSPTKVQQADVHYQTQPNDSGQKCSLCQHFISESNSCQLVAGEISPEGWCDLWTEKA